MLSSSCSGSVKISTEHVFDANDLYRNYGIKTENKQPRYNINTGHLYRKLSTTLNWQNQNEERVKQWQN